MDPWDLQGTRLGPENELKRGSPLASSLASKIVPVPKREHDFHLGYLGFFYKNCLGALDGSLGSLLGALGGSLGFTSGALGCSSVSLGALLVSFWVLLGVLLASLRVLLVALRCLLGLSWAPFGCS